MKKTTSIMITALLSALMLGACGGNGASATQTGSAAESGQTQTTEAQATDSQQADGKTYKVGVIQLAEHPALDAANKGFVDALAEQGLKIEYDQQSAQGDQSVAQTIANKFASDNNDLILAIATPAAQAVAGATTTIPVLGTAVTDYVAAGLIESNDAPGGNVTGTSDLTPVKEQMDLLKKLLPDAKTVGILYCSAEVNSAVQAKLAKEAAEALGLETKDFTVSSLNEIQTIVESMVGKVDVIYAPTDNVIAEGMTTVSMVATDNKLPIICGESGMISNGGLATYGIDYYKLGYKTGQMAADILTGKADPATTPIGFLDASECELTVNEEIAATLGIDLSPVK